MTGSREFVREGDVRLPWIGVLRRLLRDRRAIAVAFILVSALTTGVEIPVARVFVRALGFVIFPGLFLASLASRSRGVFWESLVLAIPLGFAWITMTGVLANLVLPLFGSQTPLGSHELALWNGASGIALVYLIGDRRRRTESSESGQRLGMAGALVLVFTLLSAALILVGSIVFRETGDNQTLVFGFWCIPCVVLFAALAVNRMPSWGAPLILGIVGLSVLYARTMSSLYLVGGDVFTEFAAYRDTLDAQFWSDPGGSPVWRSLGVTVLPTSLASLLEIGPLDVFRLVIPVAFALFPVFAFMMTRRHFSRRLAFISGVFVLAQANFLNLLSSQIRVGVAILYFMALTYLVIRADSDKSGVRLLSVLLATSLASAYYVTPLLAAGFLLILHVILRATLPSRLALSGSIVAVVLIASIAWWVSGGSGNALRGYVESGSTGLSFLFGAARSGGEPSLSTGASALWTRIELFFTASTFLVAGIGSMLVARYSRAPKEVRLFQTVLGMSSVGIVAAWFVLPGLANLYAAGRLALQFFFVIAPAFAAGALFLGRRSDGRASVIATVLVLGLMLNTMSLLPSAAGVEKSITFDEHSPYRRLLFVSEAEVSGARWVSAKACTDATLMWGLATQPGPQLLLFAETRPDEIRVIDYFADEDLPASDYLFLRRVNLAENVVLALDGGGHREEPLGTVMAEWSDGTVAYDSASARIVSRC